MSRLSCAAAVICVILSAAVLNILLFYNTSCTGEYIVGRDSEGHEYAMRLSTVHFADELFSKSDISDYSVLLEKLNAQKAALNEYITAWKYKNTKFNMETYREASFYSKAEPQDWAENVLGRYNYTYEQAEQKNEQLDYCISRLNYALSFPDYIRYAARNSERLLTFSMISPNSFAAKNAVKTKRDLYGLEEIRPSAESDMGMTLLFSDSITDIIAVLCAVISAVITVRYFKKQPFSGSFHIIITGAAVSAGISVMYICNGALTDKYAGLGNMLRPIQSIEKFRTGSIMMNVLTLAVLRVMFKLILCTAVYYTLSGILLSGKKTVPAVIAAASALLLSLCPAGIREAFHAENIFGVYGNLNILGNAVSPQSVFIPVMLVILTVSMIFSVKSSSLGVLAAREAAEREYYAEVGRKYEETRKIRHDINNHLSALGILINDGRTEEAKAYLGEISSELALQKPPAASGRAVLDALLFGKARTAESKNIKLEISIDKVFPQSISDYDLCGIFGNILDNAIEACDKYDNGYIRLTVRKQREMLCIFCENPYSGVIATDCETSKPDKTAHGFGIRRIEQLAAKHGGIVKISAENGIFSISVLIQN